MKKIIFLVVFAMASVSSAGTPVIFEAELNWMQLDRNDRDLDGLNSGTVMVDTLEGEIRLMIFLDQICLSEDNCGLRSQYKKVKAPIASISTGRCGEAIYLAEWVRDDEEMKWTKSIKVIDNNFNSCLGNTSAKNLITVVYKDTLEDKWGHYSPHNYISTLKGDMK